MRSGKIEFRQSATVGLIWSSGKKRSSVLKRLRRRSVSCLGYDLNHNLVCKHSDCTKLSRGKRRRAPVILITSAIGSERLARRRRWQSQQLPHSHTTRHTAGGG